MYMRISRIVHKRWLLLVAVCPGTDDASILESNNLVTTVDRAYLNYVQEVDLMFIWTLLY